MRTLVLTLALGLATAAAATAGGFATVSLSSLPDGEATWTPTMTIKAHGRTPVDGLHPAVTIHGEDGTTQVFPAVPTGTIGEYRAEVVFPSSGTWTFTIADGYSQTHTFKPVQIGPAPPADGGSSSLVWTLSGSAALALALAILMAYGSRRRPRAQPIPA